MSRAADPTAPGRFAWAQDETRRTLEAGLALFRERWPTITLDPAAFDGHARRHLDEATARPTAEACRDLALAWACLSGDGPALEVFEREVLRPCAAAVRNLKRGDDFIDEVLQRARERLIVGPEDRRPRLGDYAARGPLKGWVKILVSRLGLQMMRDGDEPVDEGEGEAPAAIVRDPEKEHLQRRYADWFKRTIKKAFADLSEADRRLVELMVRERLSLSEIGERLGQNKSTISRRMAAIRIRIFDAIQSLAKTELQVDDAEYASLVRAMQSQLDVSLGLSPS